MTAPTGSWFHPPVDVDDHMEGGIAGGAAPRCVFCDIVAGTAPARVVRDWPGCLAIVPLNPVVANHLLVIPKLHVADALEDEAITGMVFARAAELAREPTSWDCNLITSVGAPATQTVFHLHVHVVQRTPGDGLTLPWTGQ